MTREEALAPIIRIMRSHGVQCSPEEFHTAVNVAFHQNESQVYDELHRDMWESLPHEFALLAGDCLEAGFSPAQPIALLDIGCGTGLASDSILKSRLGPKIESVTLLDTSAAMLKRAAARSANWAVRSTIHEGTLESLPVDKYDLIVTCSVLHHVPDIPGFLEQVRIRQAPGGVFLHLQDPNAEAIGKDTLERRSGEAAPRLPEWVYRLSPARICGRLWREMSGKQGEDYISKTNRDLLRSNVMTAPLSVPELFAITDIHVQDGQGISIARMRAWMSSYELLAERSYGYYGKLASTLPPRLRREEDALSSRRDPNGMHIAGAWRLTSG